MKEPKDDELAIFLGILPGFSKSPGRFLRAQNRPASSLPVFFVGETRGLCVTKAVMG